MKELLYVDGYNMIHAWPELRQLMDQVNLEAARMKLIDMIGDYASSVGWEAVIVFDAQGSRHEQVKEHYHPGVKVIFTGKTGSADHYIERQLDLADTIQRTIYVATSDLVEQIIIMGRGGVRISARELHKKIKDHKKLREKHVNHVHPSTNSLENRLDERTIRHLEQFRRMGRGE